MINARIKHILPFLFLAFFLTTKLASLHVLTHDHSDMANDCAICHVLITDNQTAVVLEESQEITLLFTYPIAQKKALVSRSILFQNDLYSYYLFSRPPPIA